LELLRSGKHAEAIKSLEEIIAQAPGFRDAEEQLDQARTGLQKARLYEAALQELADEHPDQACFDLLALLKLDPEHADARSQLLTAVEGLLMQLQETREELEGLRGATEENETLRARVADLEARLEEAQAARDQLDAGASTRRIMLRTVPSTGGTHEDLLVAMGAGDQEQARLLIDSLAKPDRLPVKANLKFLLDDEMQETSRTEFWIDDTPITNADYARFVAETGHKPPEHWLGRTPPQEIVGLPVTGISWSDAAAYATWASQLLPTVEVWEKDGKEMVHVPAGRFLYGEEKEERELPEFWIDKTPVTNTEYAQFVAATGFEPPQHWTGKTPPKRIADHPVVHVSWRDAQAYAAWAGKRLLTEEEWEKAARGTDGRKYPWGNEEPTSELCNFDGNEGNTTPVGKWSPQGDSPYGCTDMAGNVWEWTSSDYDQERKALRGGSWNHASDGVRCTSRHKRFPNATSISSGFRCARDPQPGDTVFRKPDGK
jgi:formylglycine-generating enzyme required for sulfatase activity